MYAPHRVDVPVTDLDQDEDFLADGFGADPDSSFLDSLDYADPPRDSRWARLKSIFPSFPSASKHPAYDPMQPQTELRNYSIQRLNEKLNKTILVFATFIVFVLGIMFLGGSNRTSPFQSEKIILSNSTHHFHPTTIMISLDGFHPHYISPERTPALHDMLINDYGPPYMTPSFPSSTFPNHWTLVTGLYPSEHGIVGNTFFDPKLKKQFINTNPKYGLNPDFWRGGEPLWTTAGNQGVLSAIHMWPGSEVPGIGDNGPSFVDKYNGTESFSAKLARITGWLDIEDIQKRPQLILAYVPTIDQVGHKKGISGDVLVDALKNVDAFVASVRDQLALRNLQQIVNLVVVSDHGMAPTSNDRVLILDDVVDLDKIEHIDGWPLFGLRPKEAFSVDSMFKEVSEKLAMSPLKDNYNLWRVEDFPKEYNFGGNLSEHKFNYRLAPIWLVPNLGYSVVTRKDYANMNNDYHPKGVHGYNNTELLMRAIFLGSGPYFVDKLPSNKKVYPFANTEVYNILCESLHIRPSANNGTKTTYSTDRYKALPPTWTDGLSYPNVPFEVEHIVENATYDALWRAAEAESPSSIEKVKGDIGNLVGDIDDAVEDTFKDVLGTFKGAVDSMEDKFEEAVDSFQ